MDEPVSPLERDHSLCVVLPGGLEKTTTVHGSQPVMDLLVTLCASYHLDPSDYTVEALSANKNSVSFKPNSPVGLLEAERIVLKPRGVEETIRRPYVPEGTVRLLINYNKTHKTVVRVNPRVPVEMLLPAVCDKCEFNLETTVLMRDAQSEESLDLSKTLNDHGLREVFAKDTAATQPGTPEDQNTTPEPVEEPPTPSPREKESKPKESSGFFRLFRRKKKHENGLASAPPSPGPGSLSAEGVHTSNTLPVDLPKKRRAPQPPLGASVSVPNYLSSCHLEDAQSSADSTLRRPKRRAPPPPAPPPAEPLEELQIHSDVPDSEGGD